MEIAATSQRTATPSQRTCVDKDCLTSRSRITNGNALHNGVDGRSAGARRFRDILTGIIVDIAPAGPQSLSEGHRQLARRVALLCLECERLESRAVSGEAIDLGHYGSLTDRIGRCLARLGLKHHAAKDTAPTLSEILRNLPPDDADGER